MPQPLESGNQPSPIPYLQSRSCFDLGCSCPVSKRTVPRKEVIQPHLPVRLPCYDFTPITDPTLDACLSRCELAQRLEVLPTFVV